MNKEFKTYKEFINESKELDQSRFPLEDPEEVKQWIEEHLVGKKDYLGKLILSGDWNIDEQGYFSTTGVLNLSFMNLTKLPFKIKYVGVDFYCCENKLTTLEGLESLKFIGRRFECQMNNLTNFKGLENLESVGGSFWCYDNKLISFKGLENLKFVGGDFLCYTNMLTSLNGLESLEQAGRIFSCYDNKLLSTKVPFEIKGNFTFDNVNFPYKYEDSVEYLVLLSEKEQKKVLEDLVDFDSRAYRKLLTYAKENNIKLSIDQEESIWNQHANDLEDTGLEF
jgi:hypothetical protein